MFKVIVKESPLKYVEDKDEIKVLSATKGNSETLHTKIELQKHNLVLWRFGAEGSLIAKSDIEDSLTSYYDGDDGRFKGKLELDSKTGSLTITDLETKHTGEFRLKIISDRRILYKRFTVTVSGLSPGAVAGICIVLLLIAAAAVAASVMIYCRSNRYKLKNLMSKISKQLEQMSKMTKQLEQMTKTNGKDLAEISEQLKQMDESNVSENEKKELYEKLKQMSEDYDKALPKMTKQLEELREQKIPKQLFEMSEQVKQMTMTDEADTSEQATQEKAPSPEIREGERKRLIVEETAISKAIGFDKILKDKQGRKSIAINEDEIHTYELDEISLGNELKEQKDLTDDVKISEQETYADVTKEEIRPEIEEGVRERCIYVQETAISLAIGANKRLRDRQGKKSFVIRETSTEDAGVHTHGTDGTAPENELKQGKEMDKETPLMNQKEEDGPNE
ncbi:hypothetical protein Q8A67_005688 [Cirrhinus molitorella]|uniref:Uncharacterized protein n=1 Tax=Cirrhinus molitorella TaxID=172907 RepID=A0AA88PWE8_9TELE|nr:hypothetical protein Q8A67_005688 [Cirrhinus molitorella]